MLKKILHRVHINQVYASLHQLLMAAYGFLLLFIIVRNMPQEEVSRWILFISVISISDMLIQGLLQTIVVKKVSDATQDFLQLKKIYNNAFIISVVLVIVIAILATIINYFSIYLQNSFTLLTDFSKWYPYMGFLMIIYNLSWWINIGKSNFRIVLFQRIVFCVSSLLVVLISIIWTKHLSFSIVAISQVVGYLISGVYAYFVNHFSFSKKYWDFKLIHEFINYGKYTIGTMLGSSLLRNSDSFMIAAFMNNSAVAIYNLAQKFIEIFEVILRSSASTFLPILQTYKHNTSIFTSKLFSKIFFTTLFFIPLACITFLFSDTIIQLISGSNQYGLSSNILKVFMLYVVLLPADRFIGVALEAFNQPQLNLVKTIFLISTNLIGNFIALNYFHSIIGIALVSSIALTIGISVGLYLLNRNGIGLIKLFRIHYKNLHLRII